METEETKAVVEQPETKAEGETIERKYFVAYIPYGVTSFEELDSLVFARQMTDELYELNYQYMSLMENILFGADFVDDMPARIRALSLEFAARVERVLNGEVIEAKEVSAWLPKDLHKSLEDKPHGAFVVKQDADGNYWWYGKPTNNFKDRDGEILTEAAHQEFVSYLAQYRAASPSIMPELQLWHEDATAFSMKAEWVDWADNSLHLAGRLTAKEAQILNELGQKYDLAMSHGFWVLERKGELITKYRMFEASVLPREFAANTFTDFNVEKTKMAFNPQERKFLVDAFGEAWVVSQEAQNAKSAQDLRQNVEHKEYVTKEEFAEMQATMGQISAALTQLTEVLVSNAAPAEAETPVEDDKAASIPPMANVAAMLNQLDPTQSGKPIKQSSKLAQAKPEETPEKKSSGNPLIDAALSIVNKKAAPIPESEGE